MEDPEFRRFWEEDEAEFQLRLAIIDARAETGMTQGMSGAPSLLSVAMYLGVFGLYVVLRLGRGAVDACRARGGIAFATGSRKP